MKKWITPELEVLDMAATAQGNNKNKYEIDDNSLSPDRSLYGEEGKLSFTPSDGNRDTGVNDDIVDSQS